MTKSERIEDKIMSNQGLIGDAYKRYQAPIGWENEDWLSELKLIYIKACHHHRKKRGQLSTLFNRMVVHELMAIREKYMTKKRNCGLQPVSLGELTTEDGVGYEPSIIDRGQIEVDAKEEAEYIKGKLSKRELKMFKLSAEGYNGARLADVMGFRWKSWPNRLMDRARKRLRSYR